MKVLITGCAGFIGFHTAQTLLQRGDSVVGIDNLNNYYDVTLKKNRLAQLLPYPAFHFLEADITNPATYLALPDNIDSVIHLAAQAGVRHSLHQPQAYIDANIAGQLAVLEWARHRQPTLRHLVYASSSSVYGRNTKLPFAVEDPVNHPASLYAASKRSAELMAETYAHLFRIPLTGLRFFTVYGPWGRPDMAAYRFSNAIMAGTPIDLFNHGAMQRDFTYSGDIVAGILAVLAKPPQAIGTAAPHRLYNLGNARPETLGNFITLLERALGKKALRNLLPMQPGDIPSTAADITASTRDFGFHPTTGLEEGLARFAAWYKAYHRV